IEVDLECWANTDSDLIISAVYDAHEKNGPDLLQSSDLVKRGLAAHVAYDAMHNREFIASVWQRQQEAEQEERALDGKPRVKTDAEYHSLGARALGVAAE